MIAALAGLVGVGCLLGVADAWDKESGGRVFAFLAVALVCFGVSIAAVGNQPPHLSEVCDRYSVFATSC